MPAFDLNEVTGEQDLAEVKSLFREYAEWLQVDLCFQGFEEELRSLPYPYHRPNGFIWSAKVDGAWAGCIALKPLSSSECEMKRLYVRPAYRGKGIAKALVQVCLNEAASIGYGSMKLDTLARMQAAVQLYRSFGFKETDAYYKNPIHDVIYMERVLAFSADPIVEPS